MIETQLNFKSYFLQFVLCQYVKDLLDLYSPRGDSGIEPKLQPFLLIYILINSFAYKKHWVQPNLLLNLIAVSPERRCSSRTFRYGYLVTT